MGTKTAMGRRSLAELFYLGPQHGENVRGVFLPAPHQALPDASALLAASAPEALVPSAEAPEPVPSAYAAAYALGAVAITKTGLPGWESAVQAFPPGQPQPGDGMPFTGVANPRRTTV